MDPTPDERKLITNFAKVLEWAGVTDKVFKSFCEEAGEVKLVREVALMPRDDFLECLENATVPKSDADATPTNLKPVEKTRLLSMRRVCLLLVGLSPDELVVQPAAAASSGAAGSPPPASHPIGSDSGPKMKDIIDQVSTDTIVRLSLKEVKEAYATYRLKMGGDPNPEFEPTEFQLAGIQTLLKSGMAPYADFALFGPHGKRLQRRLTFSSFRLSDGGQWVKVELPGPSCYDQWLRCYKTWKVCMLLLEAASVEALDDYMDCIKGLDTELGSGAWWLIYQAEVRMRNEVFDRTRRKLEMDAEQWSTVDPRIASLISPFDPAKPWEAVLRRAVLDREHWNREIRDKLASYKHASRSDHSLTDDGTAQGARQSSQGERRYPWQAPVKEMRSRLCDKFNSGHCNGDESKCPDKASHACSTCGMRNHGEHACFIKHPELKKPPGASSKRKKQFSGDGKGGRGKTGKGK